MTSTKGASNHYGNSRGGKQGKPTTHIGFAWAKDFNKSTLQDHFQRHGKQVGCSSKEAYAAKAVRFSNLVDRKNCVSFVDRRGSTYKFNKSSGDFAVITKNGYVVTYFKPKDGYNYYLSQKKGKIK